jgi:hypothetical protein
LCVCAGFAHPVVLLHKSNVGGRRSHLRVIDDQPGPQFWRHYREGEHKQTLGPSVTIAACTYHIFIFYPAKHCRLPSITVRTVDPMAVLFSVFFFDEEGRGN